MNMYKIFIFHAAADAAAEASTTARHHCAVSGDRQGVYVATCRSFTTQKTCNRLPLP